MSRNDPTEILVAVHRDNPVDQAVLVSIDGRDASRTWIARSQIEHFELTGKTTKGEGARGQPVTRPLANLTIPEWLAISMGFV